MLPKPHGGVLVNRLLTGPDQERLTGEAERLPRFELSEEAAQDVLNIATGAFSPLEGFMCRQDFEAVLHQGRLASGVPWTLPIVLDVSAAQANRLESAGALTLRDEPLALFRVEETYPYDKETYGRQVYGTTDTRHPGVAKIQAMQDRLVGGRVSVYHEPDSPFPRYHLRPVETRVLFQAKGWRTVVGFQTRNVPHLGHEHVQKTALTFVDGIFINPVIGKKKRGDFKDEVILATYEALLKHYYLKERAAMAILETEMRYGGPREAIFHAIVRKNLGCTHFIVGRDHAGVGDFYPPYAAQEIFDDYPDLGIVPLFFTAFFFCRRCGGVANEKTCPHGEEAHIQFSGTVLRKAYSGGAGDVGDLIRPEVAQVIRQFERPFVE